MKDRRNWLAGSRQESTMETDRAADPTTWRGDPDPGTHFAVVQVIVKTVLVF